MNSKILHRNKLHVFLPLLFCLIGLEANAQFKKDTTDLLFEGTKINPYSIEYDTTSKISFSGYVDTYYAFYTDTSIS